MEMKENVSSQINNIIEELRNIIEEEGFSIISQFDTDRTGWISDKELQ